MTTKRAGPLRAVADTGTNRDSKDHSPPLTNMQGQLARFAACVFAPDDVVEIRQLPSGRSTWQRASE
ncbi:MAG: hypothetical protein JSU86_08275, partial [Phycisphaerales bacterium]